jgi:hypothetical protein
MPGATTAWGRQPARQWTPHLIKRLRGKRPPAACGALLGAPKHTVWRWEAGQAHPEARYAARLSALAEREHCLTDTGKPLLVGAGSKSAGVFLYACMRHTGGRSVCHSVACS